MSVKCFARSLRPDAGRGPARVVPVDVQGGLFADERFGSCVETMALAARPQLRDKGFPCIISKITNRSRCQMRPGTRRTTWNSAGVDTVTR